MKKALGDLWTYPATWRCITTNGYVNRSGECVMGRGVALQAKTKFPRVARLVGEHLARNGNVPMMLPEFDLITIPVKHHWRENADLRLIERSLRALVEMQFIPGASIVLPRPGCGNGGLRWRDVGPLCLSILDDRFTVIDAYYEPSTWV